MRRTTLHQASVTGLLTLAVLWGLAADATFAQAPMRPISGSYYFVAARSRANPSSGPSSLTQARTNTPLASDFYPAQGAVTASLANSSGFYPAQGADTPSNASNYYPAQGEDNPASANASNYYPAQGEVTSSHSSSSSYYPTQSTVTPAPSNPTGYYPAQGAVTPANTANYYPAQGTVAPPMAAATFYPAQGTVAPTPRYYYYTAPPTYYYPAPGYSNPYAPNRGVPSNLQRTSRPRPGDDDDYAYKS